MTPLVFFGFALLLNLMINAGYLGEAVAWYLQAGTGLQPWLPFLAVETTAIDWSAFLMAMPEIATCVIVGLISLVVRISTFESGRRAAADINHELRIYGAASLLSGLAGGMTGGILFSTSKFMADSSAKTRFAYVVIATFLALTIFADLDLSGYIPTPILGGFLLILGYSMTAEAFRVAMQQRSVSEILLAAFIMGMCLWFGFIIGVIVGFIAACMLFVFSYARVGVIRRHTTRRLIAPATERAHKTENILRENGDSIHLYELEGYVFFGSSEALFEQIQQAQRKQTETPIRFIILDFSRVTGFDSSAINTMGKMRGFCEKHGVELALSGIGHLTEVHAAPSGSDPNRSYLHVFDELVEALGWAEETLLSLLVKNAQIVPDDPPLGPWLSAEIGRPIPAAVVEEFFDRIEIPPGSRLYSQGETADTIDFVLSGSLAILLEFSSGQSRRVRRTSRQTVVGEMGFFRKARRSTTIVAEEPTTVYSLSRDKFTELSHRHPDIHDGLLGFIIRILSDRLDMTTIELSELRQARTN